MASHLAVMCRLNHFKVFNIGRENELRVSSVTDFRGPIRGYRDTGYLGRKF